MGRTLAVLFLVLTMAGTAFAVQPDEVLDDPALEARARSISAELRCLVCQNQSIDDSDAELARDLRVLVRERLVAGDSDDDVIDYVVSRYGEFVLLRPVMGTHTAVLWFAAPVLFLVGFIGILTVFVRRRRVPATVAAELTAEERARLDALLKERDH